ncbi:unnamed protein product [Polarella glacialis]|uniref:non-specific serine/threonine protein kinase n=1 Tax=Polarella glacialis TaxID=89957 RepID=A0A813KZZ8_POLGL|nr:unnamed protein product [Polarella glacialis]CAE8717480.1 unnamed protein product [Polarella glacialis]
MRAVAMAPVPAPRAGDASPLRGGYNYSQGGASPRTAAQPQVTTNYNFNQVASPRRAASPHMVMKDVPGPARPATPAPNLRDLYRVSSHQQQQQPQQGPPSQLSPARQLLMKLQQKQEYQPQASPQEALQQQQMWKAAVQSPTPPPNVAQFLRAKPPVKPMKLQQKGLTFVMDPVPLKPVKGQQVDYWSEHNKCWIPASIIDVDTESGGVFLDVKPTSPLSLKDQPRKIRARTVPTKDQVSSVQAMIKEGTVEGTAAGMFREIAGPNGRSVCLRDLPDLGAWVDDVVGLVGCQVYLKAAGEEGLTLDMFTKIFWEMIEMQQDISVQAIPRSIVQTCNEGSPYDKYDMGKVLGKGTYGEVLLATNKQSGQVRAIKIIAKEKVRGDIEFMKQEIQNLTQLDHPHILKLYEFYNSVDSIYLVTDQCSGGELFCRIREAKQENQTIPTHWVADAMLQLMMAVSHIHACHIVHLDIKSQNIMLMPSLQTKAHFQRGGRDSMADMSFAARPHVMVIDLGVATNFKPGDYKGNHPMGTPATMAPEVWRGEITPEADVFSCGCVLFELLSPGAMPFGFRFKGDRQEVVNFWQSKPQPLWEKARHAPPQALNMVRQMLELDRTRRISASACLAEPFLQQASKSVNASEGSANEQEVRAQLIKRLATVHHRSTLYKSIALKIAGDWPPNRMPSISGLFSEFDVMGNGTLSESHLVAFLSKQGVDSASAQRAATAMNLSQNKAAVDWTEFVAACVDLSRPELESAIWDIYRNADGDSDGLLSPSDLAKMLPQGHKYSSEMAANAFQELTGRSGLESGERLDWTTFFKHLRQCARDGMSDEPGMADGREVQTSQQQWGIFSDVVDAISNVTGPIFGTLTSRPSQSAGLARSESVRFPGEAAPQGMDQMLDRLTEMGFTDREANKVAILANGGQLNDYVLEQIMMGST